MWWFEIFWAMNCGPFQEKRLIFEGTPYIGAVHPAAGAPQRRVGLICLPQGWSSVYDYVLGFP
ncbi:hypothetical protein H5410_021804 [Solanum commersonii]|uniref:Uncharacterized protein n=1 Tax=Solanum commersonii TaxID=4109 RepID=A0A9J5ZC26_SOLCO|nr:hypothetical protein H5410_021804 [Solanum commersonii]